MAKTNRSRRLYANAPQALNPSQRRKTAGDITISTPAPLLPIPNVSPSRPNSNVTRAVITTVVKYLNATAPNWQQDLVGSPREFAARYARQVGVEGVNVILRWSADQFNKAMDSKGGNPPKLPKVKTVEPSGDNNVNPTDVVVFERPLTNNSYALSPAPTPKEAKIHTGIKPDTYVNDYMTPVENACACMHVSTATLQIPTKALNPNNPLSSHYENGILFDVVSKMQQILPFGVDVTSLFTTANLASAINDVIYALQVYFYYSSILSYESDSRNKNAAMQQLRSLIDTTTLSSYVQLGKRLEDLPIPPRLVEWVRFMSGNYYSGATPGSPIIKIVPTQAVLLGATNLADTAITRLSQNNNSQIFSIMRKAFKKWRIGKLYDLPTTPIYSLQFKTIFANLENGNRATGASLYFNSAATSSVVIPYNTFTNKLDGLCFAMTSYLDTAWGHVPGLCQTAVTNATYIDTKYSFYNVSGNKNFYPVVTYPFLALSRDETTVTIGTTTYYPHIYGSDRCQSVNGNSLGQSAQSVLDYLFEASGTYDRYTKYIN